MDIITAFLFTYFVNSSKNVKDFSFRPDSNGGNSPQERRQNVNTSAETNKFDLWESGTLSFYYALRDAELYLGCMNESLDSSFDKIPEQGLKPPLPEKLTDLFNRMQERMNQANELMEKLKQRTKGDI